MLLGAAVADRLRTEVTALGGRVLRSGEFTRMLAAKVFPQVTPAAAVLPVGMRGGEAVASFGQFRQIVQRRVAVVLMLRAPNTIEADATADIEDLAEAAQAALLGWTPSESTPGVVRLVSGDLRALEGGVLTYELIFALDDAIEP